MHNEYIKEEVESGKKKFIVAIATFFILMSVFSTLSAQRSTSRDDIVLYKDPRTGKQSYMTL